MVVLSYVSIILRENDLNIQSQTMAVKIANYIIYMLYNSSLFPFFTINISRPNFSNSTIASYVNLYHML